VLAIRRRLVRYGLYVKERAKMKVEPAPYSLAYYEKRARSQPVAALDYAARDINATLSVMRERDLRDPYIAKLMAEFDAVTFELIRRRRLTK
jgi:hypothetical protein